MIKIFTKLIAGFLFILHLAPAGFSQNVFCKRNYVTNVMMGVVQTADKGYVLGGSLSGAQAGSEDFHIMKTDSAGNMLWARVIGSPGDEYAFSITSSYDKGFVIAGYTYAYGWGGQEAYIAKVDSVGNLLWTRVVGGIDNEWFTSVIQTKDGGYIATGGTSSFGVGACDTYIVKFDGAGVVQWTRTVGGASDDGELIGTKIIQTADDGFAICSSSISFDFNGSSYDFYIIKLDVNGSLVWTKTVGGSFIDEPYGIVQTEDGGYAVAGRTMSFTGTKFYLVKLDATGTLQWTRTVTRALWDDCFGMTKARDGGFVLIGRSDPPGNTVNYYDWYVVKFDANGTFVWSSTIGSTDPMDWEEPHSIIETNDNGFAIVGSTSNFTNGPDEPKCFFVKIDANGNGCCVKALNEGTVGIGGTNNPTGGTEGSGGFSSSGGTIGTNGILQHICSACNTPTQPTGISGKVIMCSGSGATIYSITPVIGATSYSWSLPASWSGSSSSTLISATPGTSGVFTVTALNACGASPQRTISVTVGPCTGINENSMAEAGIKLYPNPINETLYLELTSDNELTVMSVTGQIVYATQLRSGNHQINLKGLAKGMYIVQLNNTTHSRSIKLVKE